ncbi:cell division protein SepF [Clostridium beijerinckii]|uniref:Cell division protein SepF n=2 Tax=Clostridium TaxID=1485 RepID=A0A1S8SMC3_CLOBE|nr:MULTISPECIES: cell division protein SepF [Clostridium]MBA8937193.1 cell division inhibitor SepF [Clostridium beijerinckii]MBN7572688.1 cell division protein SepF [Clostridium beijerinckii]MBN7578028.1 cell division protein SepF [Clostridium beijerinckii]MBN7582461.1 cell division protein SepF [Clostridium beijerinckii]MBO0519589.1 cell division protein SepF [Clostridium beijerinckii]
MGNVISKVKSLLGFEDYEEYDEYEEEQYEEQVKDEDEIEPVITNKKNSKVVNIHTSSTTKVTITKPVDYEEATEICEALKNRRIVLVNTTVLELKIAQRLLDFISGSCYALGGELQQIEKGVYILSPSNVEVTNELKNELSSKALFNWSK